VSPRAILSPFPRRLVTSPGLLTELWSSLFIRLDSERFKTPGSASKATTPTTFPFVTAFLSSSLSSHRLHPSWLATARSHLTTPLCIPRSTLDWELVGELQLLCVILKISSLSHFSFPFMPTVCFVSRVRAYSPLFQFAVYRPASYRVKTHSILSPLLYHVLSYTRDKF